MEKVSVIIPTYNCAKYLPEAIKSVLCQTYRDFEIIIVDDGSIDNTKEIVYNYTVFRNIKYVYQENKGPSAARNMGLRLSKGELIVFLDSDDTWDNKFLEIMSKELLENQLDLVVCDNYRLESKNGEVFRKEIERRSDIFDKSNDLFKEFLKQDLIGNPSKTLAKREIFLEIRGYDERFWLYEEWDLWIRFFQKQRRIKVIREPLFYYHIRNDGSNITRRLSKIRSINEIYLIYSKFKKNIKDDLELRSIFANYLWNCGRRLFNERKINLYLFYLLLESQFLDFSPKRILKSIKAQLILN